MKGREGSPGSAPSEVLIPLEEKLYRVKYEVDPDHPHIRLVEAVCRNCEERICTFICPAKVYVSSQEDPRLIKVNHENCLECGTCRVACKREGIIWDYPDGGKGVRYRYG